jgi:hypothetical protein
MSAKPIAAFLAEYPYSPHEYWRRDSIQRRRVSISARQFQHIMEIVYIHYWLNRTVEPLLCGSIDDDYDDRDPSSSQSYESWEDALDRMFENDADGRNRQPPQYGDISPSSSQSSFTYQQQQVIASRINNNE